MVGFAFNKTEWDNIPQALGLRAEGDVMKGLWQGSPVQSHFGHWYDESRKEYEHYTYLQADLDPPLGLDGLEHGEAMKRIVDPRLRGDIEERIKLVGMYDLVINDSAVYAKCKTWASNPDFYRAGFDTVTWAAKLIMDRRAKSPPAWELAIASEWPALAAAWGFRLDARRGVMWGNVHGRETSASVVVRAGEVMTYVHVITAFPAGCHLSLTHQKSGFWARLFRGQDINVGDPAFDDAFVVKGEPKEFVLATLTPAARERIMALTHTGTSFTLEQGRLAAWTSQLLTNREQLDVLMKASCAAADALRGGVAG